MVHPLGNPRIGFSQCGGMAYAVDLKSTVEKHVGSSPTTGTMAKERIRTSMLVPKEVEGITFRASCSITGEILESNRIDGLFRAIADRINTYDYKWTLECIDRYG